LSTDYQLTLHKISTSLHEASCKRLLSDIEIEVYLRAQSVLTPQVNETTMLNHLGRGGMKSFMQQKFYDQKARKKLQKSATQDKVHQ
jgi:hypothetical protein